LKTFDGLVGILVAGATSGGGGVILLGRMGQQMLLQMGLLREELEAELALVRPLAQMDLLVSLQIGLSAEELVAFATIESRSFAFLTRTTSSPSFGALVFDFFPFFARFDIGGGGSGCSHFRGGGEGLLLMMLGWLMRRLGLNLLMLKLLLMMLLLLLLHVNRFHLLATLRRGSVMKSGLRMLLLLRVLLLLLGLSWRLWLRRGWRLSNRR